LNYFKNFPSGIAAAGGRGGISVTQFGGNWLAKEHLERQDKMILAFQKEQIDKT
jgi:hypothetical protein